MRGELPESVPTRGYSGRLVGNAQVLEHLNRAQERGRLAHAYLFVGPDQVGKLTAARIFAGRLLGGAAAVDRHPDFCVVERERDAKTGKLHGAIVIEQVQALVGRLARGAFLGGWKVCVLDGADLMNEAAANALLKSLEEPHGRAMLILIAPSAESVMPTLKSRCQVVSFGTVSRAEIAAALSEEGLPRDQAELFARLSGGRPGTAMALAREPALFRSLRETREAVLRLLDGGATERFEEINRALPAKLPFRESADRASALLDMATELLHDAFLAASGQQRTVMHLDVYDRIASLVNARPGLPGVLAALEEVEPSKKMLRENVSPRAVLERFALSF